MNNLIWVVQGSTGEYSDHVEWAVCFYYDEEKAKQHVEAASKRYLEIQAIITACNDAGSTSYAAYYPCSQHKTLKNEFDPEMKSDYTGTNYECFPVALGSL